MKWISMTWHESLKLILLSYLRVLSNMNFIKWIYCSSLLELVLRYTWRGFVIKPTRGRARRLRSLGPPPCSCPMHPRWALRHHHFALRIIVWPSASSIGPPGHRFARYVVDGLAMLSRWLAAVSSIHPLCCQFIRCRWFIHCVIDSPAVSSIHLQCRWLAFVLFDMSALGCDRLHLVRQVGAASSADWCHSRYWQWQWTTSPALGSCRHGVIVSIPIQR